MCGITANFGGTPIDDAVKMYRKQRDRGNEGFGFLALKDARIVSFERSTHEHQILNALEGVRTLEPDTILFHHRYPTSTINIKECAHPLPLKKKGWKNNYYFIHNGVVSGQDEDAIHKAGYEMKSRVSEIKYYRAGDTTYEQIVDSEVNDSEYLGYYVASLLEGERKDIPMSGAIAAFMLQENKKTGLCTLYVMRNFMNPICAWRDKEKGTHTFQLASEGKGPQVEPNMIHRFNWKTLALEPFHKVDIGKSFGGLSGYGMYENYGYDLGGGIDRAPMIDIPKLPRGKDDSETQITMKEVERLTLAADKAYADMEEAKALLGDDDSVDAKEYVRMAIEAWEEAEEARDELAESIIGTTSKMPF